MVDRVQYRPAPTAARAPGSQPAQSQPAARPQPQAPADRQGQSSFEPAQGKPPVNLQGQSSQRPEPTQAEGTGATAELNEAEGTGATAELSEATDCTVPPAALSEQQMVDEAQQFLESKGHALPSDPVQKTQKIREILQGNYDLRRDFLKAEGESDRADGKLSLEIFSNAAQRSRFLNTKDGGKKIDGAEVGRDLGLLFAGTDSAKDGLKDYEDRNHRWNLNHPNELPPTGFREDRLNDDGSKSADQTHHLAFYAMVGATNDSVLGELFGKGGGTVSDRGNPNDQQLAYDGVDLGRRLDDPKFDVNAYIWNTVGDPCQTQAGNEGSNSGSGSDGSDQSS